MPNDEEALPAGRVSREKLSHYSCGWCFKWWSIGDAPKRSRWFCPWCGTEQRFKKVDG